ncbi:ribose-5-phosphate isomerase [Candidatus Microgenomates bacterium]|nr:ribose-5-phosphate isomerase [Candidatus Microgenomates bacterium]
MTEIYIGADHGGYELKEELKKYLSELGYQVEDVGNHQVDPQDDYPDFIIPVAQKVVENSDSLGIVLGRSGNGEQIAANKIKGIRAALCLSEKMAELARTHNDANVLSLGGDFVSVDEAKKIVKTFLETPFSQEERHSRRIDKIKVYENQP